jgi:hypothetical protein
MGYCMSQQESTFSIKPLNVPGALAAIKALAGSETITDASGRHFSWVDTREFLEAQTLPGAMKAWRWFLDSDDETDEIHDITFEGEKLGDDAVLFDAIAPFVEPGSYIEMLGEDGSLWRWVFDGKTCQEKSANISWD